MTKNKAHIVNELCRTKGIHPECEEALQFREMTIVDLLLLTKQAKNPPKSEPEAQPEAQPEVQCPGQVPETQPSESEAQPESEAQSESDAQSDSESDDESFTGRITRFR